jgi:hypothetical protein
VISNSLTERSEPQGVVWLFGFSIELQVLVFQRFQSQKFSLGLKYQTNTHSLEHLQRCSICYPALMFFHPSLVIGCFATPAIKLKLGQQVSGELLIANHMANHYDGPVRNTDQQSDLFIRLFSAGAQHCCGSHQPPQTDGEMMLSQNYFPEPNQHILTFLHLIVLCRIIYWAALEMLLYVIEKGFFENFKISTNVSISDNITVLPMRIQVCKFVIGPTFHITFWNQFMISLLCECS